MLLCLASKAFANRKWTKRPGKETVCPMAPTDTSNVALKRDVNGA